MTLTLPLVFQCGIWQSSMTKRFGGSLQFWSSYQQKFESHPLSNKIVIFIKKLKIYLPSRDTNVV